MTLGNSHRSLSVTKDPKCDMFPNLQISKTRTVSFSQEGLRLCTEYWNIAETCWEEAKIITNVGN